MARRRGGGKGGYQASAKPAAVSGPGALSQRTDGKVPQMLPSGGDYGDRTALAEQQSAAPMTPQGALSAGGTPSQPRSGPPGFGATGAFSPTQRPGEPLTAGVDWGAGAGAQSPLGNPDPLLLLKVLHERSPSAATARLIARLSRA